MATYLTTVTEIHRADSETEAAALIQEAKNDARFVLAKYNCEHKERKQKGEIIDEYFKVSLTKAFTDEKEPESQYNVDYNEGAF